MSVKLFSIKELERFSNVKAHTIRTWEKRYNIFNPERSKGNVRNYSLDDVSLLLSISLLTEYGFKISRLLHLQHEELTMRIAALKSDSARQQNNVYRLIRCMFRKNTEEFESILDESLLSWGIDQTIKMIILPFLEKVQILSYKDSSIEVHFAVNAVRRKIILGIEKARPATNDAPTALLFLPKDEHYDLVLLYMCYILKCKGFKVLYLGTNISLDNLRNICAEKKPDRIYSYIATKNRFPIDAYKNFMNVYMPGVNLYVAFANEHNNLLDRVDTERVHFVNYKNI